LSSSAPTADLVADLFAAAIDEERWPEFSGIAGKMAGIENVGVWIRKDGQIIDMSMVHLWRDLLEPYKQHFSKIDPWAQSISRASPETVMLGYEHLPERDLIKTEFYSDFARVGGMFRPMGATIPLAPRVVATIGSDLPWGKARFEEADKPRLARVLPYVKRALQLRLRQRGSDARLIKAALDKIAFGVIVCDAAGRVAFTNAAAECLARSGAGIVLGNAGSGIGALVPKEAKALAALIGAVVRGGAGGTMRLTGKTGGPALLLLVTPLPRNLYVEEGQGFALVTLRSAGDCPSFNEAILSSLFGLSPAQASIALAIFNNKAPEEIALSRGVRVSTLRTQLAEIFARTGAENQRDLVRLLGMLPQLR
jgi:DNA-binding CsgD family transcriptional regulator